MRFEQTMWDQAGRLAAVTGRNVKLYEDAENRNGHYNTVTGEIWVNTRGHDVLAQVFSHEMTHSLEEAGAYEKLSEIVLSRMAQSGIDLDVAREAKRKQYERQGHALQTAAAVDQELVAEYVSKYLLTDEASIVSLVKQDRTLGQRILGWFDSILAKLGNKNAQERAFLSKARDLYAKALRQTQGVGAAQAETKAGTAVVETTEPAVDSADDFVGSVNAMLASGAITDAEYDSIMDEYERWQEEQRTAGERKYSFAGEKAKTADLPALLDAVQQAQQGADPEAIRKETGWFKGSDGKWRFEIDDSGMQYHRAGDALFSEMHPDYARHQELEKKFLYGELTETEEQEFRQLNEIWGNERQRLNDRVRRGNATLQNVLQHDALFEAYPELRGTKVIFAEMEAGERGSYNPNNNTITISESLRSAPEGTLLHEIQHAIQHAEGFSPGASVDYWKAQRAGIIETISGARKNLDLWLEDIGYPEYRDASLREVVKREKTLDQHWRDIEEFKANSKYARQIAACEAELAEFQRQYDEITGGMTPSEQYSNTAGEIEARDAANRRSMTAEERKNSPPDLGDENTVFAESSGISLDRDISEYPYDMQTVIREYMDAVDPDVLAFVNEVHEGKAWKGKKIAVGEADARFANDVRSVLDIDIEIGSRILLATNAVEHIERRHGENGAHDQSMKNPNDLARIKFVIENYDSVEDGRKASGEYKNSDGTRARTVVLNKKINGTYFVVEAVPDTGKVGIVSAYISKRGTSQVPDASTPSRDAQNELASVPKKKVPQQSQDVKQKFSLGEDTVSKKDVARELQAILQRGGDVSELKQYVAQLEGSGGKAEQGGRFAEQKWGEAEQILENAKRRGISVEQYLQENAELYESDGQWNADARRALELEKKGYGRKWSVAEAEDTAAEDQAEAKTEEQTSDLRSSMPKKAKDYLKRVERDLLWTIGDKLSVPKLAGRDTLLPIIQEMADVYLRDGTIPRETIDLLFEKAYAQAVVVDAEFYNQYKEIKDHLRNTSVTISDRDKADIADFKDFRKRAFGTLRIVNEGGLPVDTAYQELHSMAPELFPESITHPADQLVRMYDAARSIQVTEKTVHDYYGEHEPEYRRWAKADFETAVQDATGELWTVKRYAEDKAARESEAAPATEAEAMEAYKDLKAARRTYERAAAKNLLSAHDEMQVGRLLRHEIELEHLDPEKDNVKGITAVFEAKREYERLCKLIGEYKKHLRGESRKVADGYLETANDWKDKKMGIAYSRETMERNIFDIIKDKALAQRIIDQYFAPVHQGEAAAARFKNDYRDRVRALELSRKVDKGNAVSEAHAVQLLGEAEDNIRMLENTRGRIKNRDGKNLSEWRAVVEKLWAENPNLDKGKIEKAVKEFRYIYDALFQKMNQVRVANGYEPVNYRNGYFPHFQPGDSDSILAQFGRALGIDTRIDALPTTINGLTHTFKPGIQWFGNAQERLGFSTAYDAVEGFDKYIEGVASVIHQTANIQNLRALASQIRYRTSDEGIRKQVDEIYERQGISDEEKQQLISEIYAHGKFTLSNFVTELDEYTNLLANKKSRYDRSIEAALGRKAYTFLKTWEARVGANMIVGNLTSALTNFIPLTQAGAQMDRFALLHGMFSTLQAYRSDDGIVNRSTFLTNSRGSDPLVQTWAQKASDVLGKPMELIDGFVSDSIVRGAYYQNLKRGMSEAEAMAQADAFAASLMADRSKGAMPTMLQARNPLFKAFTQFQLEVNNQFSEVFKDIPRRFKEKGLGTLALVLLKYFLGAFLYNELYEELIGRRPALDPIGLLCEAYDDLRNDGFGAAGASLATNLLEQLPFSSGLTLIGVELDGGRIPASSAVPDLTALWDAATAEGWSAEKRWKEVQDELNKLAYVVTPFGGNQISKAVKGVKAYAQGGSYNVDADGNDILQYPVYKDDPQDAFWNLVKAAFLGKSSLQEAQDWVDSGFDGLNTDQTATYQALLELGATDRAAFDAVTQLKNAGGKAMDKLQVIQGLALTDEEKAVLVGSVLGTDLLTESGGLTQYAKFDYAIQNGMGVDEYIEYRASGADIDKYLELRDAGASIEDAMNAGMALAELKDRVEDPTTVQKWRVVIDSTDDPEKQLISLSAVMTAGQYAKLKAAYGFGVSPEAYVEVSELLPKYDADGNGRYTQAEVTKVISSLDARSSVKAVLWQLITGSASAKNNPYSSTIGQKVIDAWEKAKAEGEAERLSFQDEIMRQIMGG